VYKEPHIIKTRQVLRMGLLYNRNEKEIYRGFVLNDALQACERVRAIIHCIENAVTLNSDQSFDIRVILSELVQNAIKHGSINNNPQRVFMKVCLRDQDNLVITIRDQGCGFNAAQALQEEQNRIINETSELMEYGRGLHIVRNLCEDIVFNRRGNCITVRKKLQ